MCAPVYADLSSWKRVATMLVALAFGLAPAACSLMPPSSSPDVGLGLGLGSGLGLGLGLDLDIDLGLD